MALVKNTLKAAIKKAFKDQRTATDPDAALEDLSEKIAVAIDAYIKTAQVNPGIAVSGGASTTGIGTLS